MSIDLATRSLKQTVGLDPIRGLGLRVQSLGLYWAYIGIIERKMETTI